MDGAASLGEWIRRWRAARHLSQSDLARRVPCAVVTVRKIEADERRPSTELAERLADALELTGDARAGFFASARGAMRPDRLPPPALPALVPSNVPRPPTVLIGREREIAELTGLLADPYVRLVTLTGPGGTGKTHLALHVAQEVRGDFADGAWFVDLAPITDPGLVAPAVARSLGLREVGDQPVRDRLLAAMRDRELLLVLDNFEQVLAAAPLVAEMLAVAPSAKALVTSRAILRLRGEHEFLVPPLALPDLGALLTPEALARVPSVQLFRQRARAVRRDFALTGASARAVAEICVRLDGLPLAVELAAAQADVYGPQDIAAGLQRWGLGVLTQGQVDLPPRQQTMRNAIAWSDALLAPDEQQLFRRLGVFAGGFTLEAVQAVCNAAGDLERDAWEGVAALVRKSLLRRAETEGETRFELLDTIREYALERLEASGEALSIRTRHAAHFTAMAEEGAPQLVGRDQVAWLDRLEREQGNLRAALRWLIGRNENTAALRLAGALWRFWWAHGHRGEGRQRLAEVLALSGSAGRTVARARALLGAAAFVVDTRGQSGGARRLLEEAVLIFDELGDRRGAALAQQLLARALIARAEEPGPDRAEELERARTLADQNLVLGRELDDPGIVAGALFVQALIASREGDRASARGLLMESMRIWREQGDRISMAYGARHLGWTANYQGDLASTRALLEESLALFGEVGDRWSMARVLGDLGEVATAQGDYAAARNVYDQGLRLWRELGDRQGVANMLGGVAYAVTEAGEFGAARAVLTEALAIRQESGDPARVAWSLAGFAYLAAARGQAARAVRLTGAAAALREASGWESASSNQTKLERRLGDARAALGEEAAAAAWREGREMSLEAAVEYALGGE